MAHQSVLTRLLGLTLILILWAGTASASWLIYHKPEFSGQILDQETKQGIEGAAVVALYHKWTMGLGAGSTHPVIHVREAVTDKDGRFHIPPYTTLILPFSGSDDISFIIYKPGYIGIDRYHVFDYEGLFSGEYPFMPDKTISESLDNKHPITIRHPNIIEIPPIKTKEERIKAIVSPYLDEWTWEDQRHLIELIRSEEAALLGHDPKKHYKLRGD